MPINSSFWKGKRVLITGHTGFKGSWLAIWLNHLGALVSGIGLDPIYNLSLFESADIGKLLENSFQADIRSLEHLKKLFKVCDPEVVFHLAAQPLVRESYRNPLDTWSTNVQGSLNVLEALKHVDHFVSVVMITTDKVYENREWCYGYREDDQLGGYDPYSASKAAAEIAIASWRRSFCGNKEFQTSNLGIATARAGNVIGGGDWAENRIIPDAIRSLADGKAIPLRNPNAKRPWQHVLEPLSGYISLAEALSSEKENLNNRYATAYNFGPLQDSNKSVTQLIERVLVDWPGSWLDISKDGEPHEACILHLSIDKAQTELNWQPVLDFNQCVFQTVRWYKEFEGGEDAHRLCIRDIKDFLAKQLRSQ